MRWHDWKQTLSAFALTAAVASGGNAGSPAAETTRPAESLASERRSASSAPRDEISWQAWNPAAVAKARSEGRPVLVSFTANWCATEHLLILDVPEVRQRLRTIQAATFVADFTRPDEGVTSEMKKFGRDNVPLVLVYPHDPGMAPLVLPKRLTTGIVMDALQYAILPEAQFITPAIKPVVEAARRGNPMLAEARGFGSGGFGSSGGAQALEQKLETIRLEEVKYDAIPLSIVVEQLVIESVKRDPAKRGVNFLFARPTETPTPSVDPATGLPEHGAPEPVDVQSIPIRIMPALRNVRLIDVLNAITRVADTPIRYSIEDYAVVFSAVSPFGARPSSARVSPLIVKTYKINTNTFLVGAAKTFGVTVSVQSNDPNDIFLETARRILANLGVGLPDLHKVIFYNHLTGVLMVRATAEDLVTVDAAMATLGAVTEGPSQTASGHTTRP